jgi:hypothetical protein
MPILKDPSLESHAEALREAYSTSREAMVSLSDELSEFGFFAEADPLKDLPEEVQAARERYEEELGVELEILKYVKTVDGELYEAVDSGEDLPDDPVQLARSVTVSSSQGAIMEIEQWLASARPKA